METYSAELALRILYMCLGTVMVGIVIGGQCASSKVWIWMERDVGHMGVSKNRGGPPKPC